MHSIVYFNLYISLKDIVIFYVYRTSTILVNIILFVNQAQQLLFNETQFAW